MIRVLWRDSPMRAKGLVVVAIPVLPLLITGGFYFGGARRAQEATADTERSWRNRTLLTALRAGTLQSETAVRGHLLSDNPALLDVARRAEADVSTILAEYETNANDPLQEQRARRARELVSARFSALQNIVNANRTHGLRSPEMMVHVRRGAAAMGELDALLEQMIDRNSELLAARTQRAELLRNRAQTIVGAGVIAGVLGGGMAALLFASGIGRRISEATLAVGDLAAGVPLAAAPEARDELGTLRAGMTRASALLTQREQELRHRMQELGDLTRELEAFSYSVSHDLRAPLRHVSGFASLLQRSAGSSFTDDQRRYTRTIVDAAQTMGRLIDDLLAFSRTSRSELTRQPVDLDATVRDVQDKVSRDINGRRVEWRRDPLPTVYGDPAMLRVVFDNLLSNAVKYTGGREHAVIEVGSRTNGSDETVIYVRDNGVGFDMQYQHKLFGVFQRLHSSDEFAGTGIGLATVRRIVARHGGRVWGEGHPGEGATFYVALPTSETVA